MVVARLFFDRPFVQSAPMANLLRGAICRLFPNEPLLHQHDGEKTYFRYPLVQFRWYQGIGYLIGQREGAALLLALPLLSRLLQLGTEVRRIAQVEYDTSPLLPERSESPLLYRIATPWLPFNQERHQRYTQMNAEEQAAERDRLARSQLLMTMKGIGFFVDWPLEAHIEILRETTTLHKGNPFLGFLGYLEANIKLPNHLAFGRSISHGYGWLVSPDAFAQMKKIKQNDAL
jgi:hypothetical protein